MVIFLQQASRLTTSTIRAALDLFGRPFENLRTDWEERTPFWGKCDFGLVIFELKTLKICDFSIYIIVVLGTRGIEW
jgi:hypothetical protein